MKVDPDAVAAFGRHLLRERELRGLARDEVARRTKLAAAVVEALESGDREQMPPRAYLLGYLRSYAAAVGLDPDEVVLRWQEVEGGRGAEAVTPAARRPRLVLAAAVLALASAAAWVLSRCGGAGP